MFGYQTIFAADFNRDAAATYAANFPGAEVACSPVHTLIDRIPPMDILIGGPPCQPFSMGGEGKGHEDERDGIPDYIEVTRVRQPRQFLMENVPGILRKKFVPYVAWVMRAFDAVNYVVEMRTMDAVSFGVPQFRKRVWFWGIRKDLYAAGVRHKWPAPTHAWPGTPGLQRGVTVGEALGLDLARPAFRVMGGGAHRALRKGIDSARDITHEPCITLNTEANHGDNAPKVVPYRWSDAMLSKHPPASPDAPAPTILQKIYKGGAEGLLSVDGRTWESRHPVPTTHEPSPTVRARSPRDGGRCTENVVRDGGMVRRFTPAECMRLQSAPDDFAWPEKISNTAKYKIAGNGQASLMVAHLADCFREIDPVSRTLVDLYCGGGLGACGWHGRFYSYHPATAERGAA